MKRANLWIIVVAIFVSALTSLVSGYASDVMRLYKVSVPHEFAAGDVASANDVNENFQVLADAITTLEGSVGVGTLTIQEDGGWMVPAQTTAGGGTMCDNGGNAISCACKTNGGADYMLVQRFFPYSAGGRIGCNCAWRNTSTSSTYEGIVVNLCTEP